ncbi:MAG: hypothetical protein OXR66_01030 [Candidatus Woesearchaeota archaeon]|nr:hypothetical protein [Candidatus Woesearchaeota archaeon]
MVNINIEIPDDLHKQVKLSAITNDTTVKDYIIKQLEERLEVRQ